MTFYNRLTESDVETALAGCPDGTRMTDGEGLSLIVRGGSGWWTWRYRDRFQGGKAVEIGLGPLSGVSLANARILAESLRQQMKAGYRPVLPDGRRHGASVDRSRIKR
jgi:hypothetical protein